MSDELVPEVVEEAAEPIKKKRTRRKKEAQIVIEHDLEIEEPLLYERLEEAADKLARNGE